MKLYILACKNNTILNKLIHGVMKADITHIAIQITDKTVVETGIFGIKISKLKNIDSYRAFRFKDISPDIETKILEYIIDTAETGYDYKLFFAFGINKLLEVLRLTKLLKKFNIDVLSRGDDPNKLICVEGIVEACRQVGNFELLPHKKDAEIGPWDIPDSPYLEEI